MRKRHRKQVVKARVVAMLCRIVDETIRLSGRWTQDDAEKIWWIAFKADFEAYRQRRRSISGCDWFKTPSGPRPGFQGKLFERLP